MIDSRLRKTYDTLFIAPLLKMRLCQQMHPLWITSMGCVFGIIGAICISWNAFASVACLIFSGFLDTLDGAVARKRGLTSSRGAVLDILCDRSVEFTVILGLFLVEPQERGLMSLLMLGSVLLCVTSFLVVGIFTKNASEKGFHYSPGWIERTEAFLFFISMILWPQAFMWLSGLFTVLTVLTALVRATGFYRHSS